MVVSGCLAQSHEAVVRSSVVELWAELSKSPPHVTLRWNEGVFPATGIAVQRRLPGEVAWGQEALLDASATAYADATAAPGALYEYRVVRSQGSPAPPQAEGWLWAGLRIPATEQRGRIVLVVDASMAAPLEAEIDRLVADLVGDGWEVARTDVSRSASPSAVKDAIRGWYAVAPEETKAVLLLGRIAVPYSGLVCPDGHWDEEGHHRGAWPTDAYYGDMDGIWTDEAVNYALSNADGERNHNTPGDGKFDVSLLVGEHLPELVVGRVDFANMEVVAGGLSEAELLRRYLDRHHAFRHRQGSFATLGDRALIHDAFGPELPPFAAEAWAAGVAIFGNGGVAAEEWIPTLRDHDRLFAYGAGPGSFTGAGGVSTSADFRDTRCGAVFNLLFGSYFGDWDSADNYLRASLAGRQDSHGLVSVWAGIPRWRFFPLAAGGTVADAYRHTLLEINQPEGPFPPSDASWTNPDQCHVAILGDPVLRSHPAKPISDLAAQATGSGVALSWGLPSAEPARLGCRIYRSAAVWGPYAPVGTAGPDATGFVDPAPGAGTWHYQVRSMRRQRTASASYDNLAQGVFASVEVFSSGLFGEWSAGLSDASESGDPNGDGVPNLLAYALGAADGMASATDRLPRMEADGGFSVTWSSRPDVNYEIQLSNDLSVWYTVAAKPAGGAWSLRPESGYPGQGQVDLTVQGAVRAVDASPGSRRFWRLRASR